MTTNRTLIPLEEFRAQEFPNRTTKWMRTRFQEWANDPNAPHVQRIGRPWYINPTTYHHWVNGKDAA